ncbi:sigma-70 family RNA polymerase sigma factor [Dongia sp. agr-C8]
MLTSRHEPPVAPAEAEKTVASPMVAAGSLSETETAERHAVVWASVVEYLPDLRAFANALVGSRHQADDLVQVAILRALEAAQQFTPGTNFKAWVFTILRNVLYNQWRSPASRHMSLDDCIEYAPTVAPSQQMTLEFCDFRRAFAQLVPEQREALLLISVSGFEYGEAAAMCGCAIGTVKSRVSRARAVLRGLMDGGSMALRRQHVSPVAMMDVAGFGVSGVTAARPYS